MGVNKEKVVLLGKTEDGYIFVSVMPNISGNHFLYKIDKFGKTTKLGTIRTDKLPPHIIEKIKREKPWVSEKIDLSLKMLSEASQESSINKKTKEKKAREIDEMIKQIVNGE